MQLVLTPELILEAYRQGLFPMAYSADSPFIHWVCPERRGQLSIPDLHIPRRLKKTVRQFPYDIRIDHNFEDVIKMCAQDYSDRPETWINQNIMDVYIQLHAQGHAHSVEAWDNETLVGGLYGLRIGGAFFGESMFSRSRDASKICLIHLAARLWAGGFRLLDTQFVNDHLQQFGVYEIVHADYKAILSEALQHECDFSQNGEDEAELVRRYLDFQSASSRL